MGKIKVLTVQFDVTHLNEDVIECLMQAVTVQGEHIDYYGSPHGSFITAENSADVLNTSVREVDCDDV